MNLRKIVTSVLNEGVQLNWGTFLFHTEDNRVTAEDGQVPVELKECARLLYLNILKVVGIGPTFGVSELKIAAHPYREAVKYDLNGSKDHSINSDGYTELDRSALSIFGNLKRIGAIRVVHQENISRYVLEEVPEFLDHEDSFADLL